MFYLFIYYFFHAFLLLFVFACIAFTFPSLFGCFHVLFGLHWFTCFSFCIVFKTKEREKKMEEEEEGGGKGFVSVVYHLHKDFESSYLNCHL